MDVSVTPPVAKTIAIVGGGLSGSLVAANLLRLAQAPVRIVLIERHPPLGRGVAYGTDCPEHLLNVVASRLGAQPEDPEHFYRWVSERIGEPGFPAAPIAPTDFLPRRLFGQYIAYMLTEARGAAQPESRFEIIPAEATDLEERNGRALLTFADGVTLEVDRVVLALGNLPGEYPIRRSMPFYHGSRYVHVPWREGMLDSIGRRDDVLIIGAGLSAIDIIVQLELQGHRGRIHLVSRRGLQPQIHRQVQPYPAFFGNGSLPATIREIVHRVRKEVRDAATIGVDWRAVIDAIRPHAQSLWKNLSWEESGRLKYYAGRLQSLREIPNGAEAVFRIRGTNELHTLQVAKVINCTGPRTDYSKYQHPLLINLLARGLIDHDPLALGINALPSGEVLRYRAGPTGWLFTLGAPLKGVLWESTAVPEIRTQAKMLAQTLLLS